MPENNEVRLVQRRPMMPCCLLLLIAEAPSHGYELAERLKKWKFELAGPGPVYRELRVLEERGLVKSAWSPAASGPVPRVYELTPEGQQALDQCADDLTEIENLLDEFHGRHAQLVAARPRRNRRVNRVL